MTRTGSLSVMAQKDYVQKRIYTTEGRRPRE